jgi:ABC-type sugar transport system substrate-binding protein
MNRLRTIHARVLAMLAVFTIVASCGSKSTTVPEPLAGPPARIAVVVSTLNNPWFVVLADTAKAEAQQHGYKVTIFDSQNDPARESSNFDNIVSSGYKAVLFNATDAGGSVANAMRAHDANIPVFTMDREINSQEAAVSQVVSDNYAGAVALGENFVVQLSGHGRYVELLGIVTDNNTWNRSKGFHSVVDRYPELKMLAQQSADFDRSKAMEVMDSILQAHSDIDAVFCGNDAMALGAYQALLADGRAGKVKIFGFDGSEDAIKAIIDGKLAATAMQYPKIMAKTVADYADRYLKGDHSLPAKVPVAVDLVTPGNATTFGDYGKRTAP